jgi:hypothetical protein
VTGVLSLRYGRPGIQLDEPREAVLRAIGSARGRYDSLLVLAYLPEDELQQLAASLPEADALVGGPTGQSIAPRQLGPTLMAAATNKGKFLIQLETRERGKRAAWTGQVVELDSHFTDDPGQLANVRRYLDDLGRRDFAANDSGFVPALPSGLPRDYRLAGNQACVECHKADCQLWDQSKHGHAWQTLTERGYHVDSYCQQCHTTGYGLPGGFESAGRSLTVRSVGCESCHGPAQAHVRNPKLRTPFAARDQCQSCHDHENSPQFNYATYWPRIEHGKPAEKITDQRSPQR